jgi:hypothetical protein
MVISAHSANNKAVLRRQCRQLAQTDQSSDRCGAGSMFSCLGRVVVHPSVTTQDVRVAGNTFGMIFDSKLVET